MLPFGYWSSSTSYPNSGTLGSRWTPGVINGEVTFRDPFANIAPSVDCLENCQVSLVSREDQNMFLHQLGVLMEKIEQDTNNSPLNTPSDIWEMPEADSLVFSICKFMSLSDSVKYLACEIHDRFISKLNEDLIKIVTDMSLDAYNLKALEIRTQELAVLRIGTCVQLASKMNSSNVKHRELSVDDLRTVLHALRCNVSVEIIQQSELRVFGILNYNLNIVTRLDVVEAILIQLGLTVAEYRQVYTLMIYTLDHLYLNRHVIRNEFYSVTVSRNPSIQQDSKLLKAATESNKFVEAAATVITSLVILNMEDHPAFHVASQLAKAQANIEIVINLIIAIIHCTRDNPHQIINQSNTLRIQQSSKFPVVIVSPTTRST